MNLLGWVARLRQRLDDEGGNTGTVPSGYTYFWEADDSGPLWKNAELVRYLDTACSELAHRVPIVDDSDNETTSIPITAGRERYAIDPRVLAIDNITLGSTGVALFKDARAATAAATLAAGNPTTVWSYREDFATLTLTLINTPTANDTLYLTVRRLPLDSLDWSQRTTQEPEFPAHLQESLLDWACMQAYMKRDADAQNMELAGYFQGQFTDRVGPRISFQLAQVHKEVAGVRLRCRTNY